MSAGFGAGIGASFASARATSGQAAETTSASSRPSLCWSSAHRVTEKPVMFSAVMNDPTNTRAGFKPRFLSHSRAAFAATCSSRSGVAPSELIITATFGAGGGFGGFTSVVVTFSSPSLGGVINPSRHFMYPTLGSVIFCRSVSTIAATFVTGAVAAPRLAVDP